MRKMNGMGKRAVTLIMALVMIFTIIPVNIYVVAEDDAESVIGSTVRIVNDMIYMYREAGSYAMGCEKTQLPEILVILDVETKAWGSTTKVYYKLGTVDGSSHAVLNTHCWTENYNVEIVAPPAPPENEEGYIEGQVGLVMDGETVSELVIEPGEKTYVFTELGSAVGDAARYQWQMLIDKENNRWANILDYYYPYAAISEALIANACDETGTATIRCVATKDGIGYVSGEMTLNVDTSVAPDEPPVVIQPTEETTESIPAGKYARSGSTSRAVSDAFHVVVNYVFRHADNATVDGSTAAGSFTATLDTSAGQSFTGTITSPPVPGYLPYQEDPSATEGVNGAIKYDGKMYSPANTVSFSGVTTNTEVTVYYIPQQVYFLVLIYEQNLLDDGYTLVDTRSVPGYTEAMVGENLALGRTGFEALYYDPKTLISGGEITEVELYYDRLYYLVEYDLQDTMLGVDGYGIMPAYVRYDTTVMQGIPTAPGYKFTGWSLQDVTDENKTQISNTTTTWNEYASFDQAGESVRVHHNLKYKANWEKASTSYTIAYWLENTDSADSSNKTNYDIWYTVNKSAQTGDATDANASTDSVKRFITTTNGFTTGEVTDVNSLYPYLTYMSALSDTATKIVAGDGTTVINVYYSRKQYTLKFYYAIQNTQASTYHIIGGSTYGFGTDASWEYRNDEILLMRQYASGDWAGRTGTVKALPTLNAVGQSRSYNTGYDPDGNYRYHYISFNARYGADISNLWPCGVFNAADINFTNQYWSGGKALVSAWNGESRVKYTSDTTVNKGNQTIKGNYTELDENLLWNDTSVTDTTVTYACFWEGGANIDWSIPELYRYKIWLPVLDGVTYPTTKTINGFTYTAVLDTNNDNKIDYYLADCYDTCDDSTAGKQTHPAIVGYDKNESASFSYHVAGSYNDTEADSTTNNLGVTTAEATAISNMVGTGKTYKAAVVMNYFYTRQKYNLVYDDNNGKQISFEDDEGNRGVSYGTSLNTGAYKKADFGNTNYPNVFEANEATFGGWYIDEACQNAFSFDITMPAKNIKLYAKWITNKFSVEVYQQDPDQYPGATKYLDLTGANKVLFGASLFGQEPKDPVPPITEYIFAGWYYKENGEEKRFDFNTMPIKQDYVIYAKWTSHVPVEFTVYYKTKDANGDYTKDVAPPMKGKSLAGVSKEFFAKVGPDLDTTYQKGYFPTVRSHKLSMNAGESNVYTFHYDTSNAEIPYTVNHVFHNEEFADYLNGATTFTYFYEVYASKEGSAEITVRFDDSVTKANIVAAAKALGASTADAGKVWEIVTKLSPDAYQKDVILTTNAAANVIEFNWEDRGSTANVYIIHYTENLDGSYTRYSITTLMGTVGQFFSAGDYLLSKLSYGYSVDVTTVQTTTTTNGGAFSGTVPASATGVLSQGLVLSAYYPRKYVSYKVEHILPNGTTETEMFNQVKYGETKKVNAYGENENATNTVKIDKDVYTTISGESQTKSIVSDDYTFYFYYAYQTIYFKYQVMDIGTGTLDRYNEDVNLGSTAKGSTPTPAKGYIFEGWYMYDSTTSTYKKVDSSQADVSDGYIQPKALTAWATKEVTFYAKFVPTSLTIKNQLNTGGINPNPALDIWDQGFIYRIQGVSSSATVGVDVRVAVVSWGGDGQTILGLPVGDYTVTLESAWSWRYTDDVSSVALESPAQTLNKVVDESFVWEFTFDGTEIMNFSYSIPGPDVAGTTEETNSYYITDNAYSTQN